MPIPAKVKRFLDRNKVKYEAIEHRTVFTAFDKATTLRVLQKIVGKTLALKTDPTGKPSASYGAGKTYALALIPSNKNLDKMKFKKVAKAKHIDFAKEVWIKKNLKGVKVGAVPPFGFLWKLPTFADRSLMNQKNIIVNGGAWNWSIKITPAVFKKMIPGLILGGFCKPR